MSYIRLQNLKEFEALGERNLIPLKSISNGFFKANFRVKTPQKPTPTASSSPCFRLELLQCFSTNKEHCSIYCSHFKCFFYYNN